MRARPRHSREANSLPLVDMSDQGAGFTKNTIQSDETCPLRAAIRDELQALGASVSEIQQHLLSGDLKNAEDVFGNIMGRLRDHFCPPDPTTCGWVREGDHRSSCDLLKTHATPYLHSIDTKVAAPQSAGLDPVEIYSAVHPDVNDRDHGLNHRAMKSESSVLDDLVEQALRF
jgi:hypothetical protein